jgi:serine/threonine protein kinase
MHATLTVVAGPHVGKEFRFDRHDTFLVGRAAECHLQLSYDDKYFSRRHFLVEVNPPRLRVVDLDSSNGIRVNGKKVRAAELRDGDRLQAGKTVFQIEVAGARKTVGMPGPAAPARRTDGLPTAFPDIPGFELTKELGRGGMGVVYKAKREADGRRVAVKTILPTIAADQADLDRFVREATILAQIDHPNVVKYLATGAVEPLVYLVMEYVNGPTAHQIVKERGPMTPVTGVKLVAQASRGLTHAHGRGFVHRDIKPANLLVGKAGDKRVVKVADFGLARAFAESRLSGLTLMDDIRGTPPFMAPDQIINYRQVTPAADQYSTAATLYWLLTAKFPHDFDTGDPCRAFAKILSEDPVPIRDRRPAVPAGLAAVIHRALLPDPGRRYADVADFAAELLANV